MSQKSQPRVVVYVDGFNFYYGALKKTSLKWVDHRALAEALLRGYSIEKVKYFTARVKSRPNDPGLSQRQNDYIRALAAHADVEVHFGQFKLRPKRLPLARNLKKFARVISTEEKGSDVSLGAHLVWDACHNLMEAALVISNDSDLQTPVDMAEKQGITVITLNPHRRSGQPRRLFGTEERSLRLRHLRRSQLPDPVVDEQGGRIPKPREWR